MPSQTKYASIQSLNNHQQSIAVMNDDTETWLKALQKAPLAANQRTLAKKLGFSVGKTNYILKALIAKGHLKAERFINSNNKRAYRYVLTPSGLQTRIKLAEKFIQRKKEEYEALQRELEELKAKHSQ